MSYALSKDYHFYFPSDNLGVVAFCLNNNNLVFIPQISAELFKALEQNKISDIKVLAAYFELNLSETKSLFADLLNKGIVLAN